MNLSAALQAGGLLQWAYSVYSNPATPNYDGMTYGGFSVLQTIYANDLATDIRFIDPAKIVSMGFVARSIVSPDEFAIVIRGTIGGLEWIENAKVIPLPFSPVPGSGLTEQGFTNMYNSLHPTSDLSQPRLASTLPGILGPLSANPKLTICGHSLGGALATLLALDVSVNIPFKTPALITFASPMVGDPDFVNFFNAKVPNSVRIVNMADMVPKLPFPIVYKHVATENALNPGNLVKNNPLCEHSMSTYMFLLDSTNQLEPQCKP